MDRRTRLASWSLAILLFAIPLCAALALEHASAEEQKAPPASSQLDKAGLASSLRAVDDALSSRWCSCIRRPGSRSLSLNQI